MLFVKRAEWGARPPKGAIQPIDSVVTTGHWEGGSLWGGTIGSHDSCATKVRAIQNYHMDHNGWIDIAYNGLGCPHAYVFEGRGPQRRSAANGTNEANNQSAVMCYLGGQGDPFTAGGAQAMKDGAAWLGDDMKKGHRDWYNTQCPGDEIYHWIVSGGGIIIPIPPIPVTGEDEDVLHIVKGDKTDEWWLTDWQIKRYINTADEAAQIIVSTRASGGKIECSASNGPVTYPQTTVDRVPRSDV